MPKKITATQRAQILKSLLKTAKGRHQIAATIQEPLRSLRDYEAVGRKALMVDELPQGEIPVYDKDIDTPAYVVAEEGQSIQKVVKGERILVPTFEIASYITIPFTQVQERRFDVVGRIKKKTRDEVFRAEDFKIFQAMEAIATNNTINPALAADLSMENLAEIYALVSRHGLRVDKFFMRADMYKVIQTAGRDYLDFETQRELLNTGYQGMLWGAQIWTSPEIPVDRVYAVTEPEFFGVTPVRIDLTVLPADDTRKREFGWSVFEAIGIGMYNERGIASLEVTAP